MSGSGDERTGLAPLTNVRSWGEEGTFPAVPGEDRSWTHSGPSFAFRSPEIETLGDQQKIWRTMGLRSVYNSDRSASAYSGGKPGHDPEGSI